MRRADICQGSQLHMDILGEIALSVYTAPWNVILRMLMYGVCILLILY
jgi:hypothetical protein